VWNEESRKYHVYLTNLPVEVLSAEDVATLYGCRWEIDTVCTASPKRLCVSDGRHESPSSVELPRLSAAAA
ncbi:MAG: hypothetical protein ACREDE_08755, partial [Thermoplasmata archaeon]